MHYESIQAVIRLKKTPTTFNCKYRDSHFLNAKKQSTCFFSFFSLIYAFVVLVKCIHNNGKYLYF